MNGEIPLRAFTPFPLFSCALLQGREGLLEFHCPVSGPIAELVEQKGKEIEKDGFIALSVGLLLNSVAGDASRLISICVSLPYQWAYC